MINLYPGRPFVTLTLAISLTHADPAKHTFDETLHGFFRPLGTIAARRCMMLWIARYQRPRSNGDCATSKPERHEANIVQLLSPALQRSGPLCLRAGSQRNWKMKLRYPPRRCAIVRIMSCVSS